MAELPNSRRISYKATYAQVSGAATLTDDTGTEDGVSDGHYARPELASRAIDKAAFVHSLGIIPDELPGLREALSAGDRRGDRDWEEAFSAVERLVRDGTASSTLNQAAAFGRVPSGALVDIARALIRQRESVAAAIKETLGSILDAHRDSVPTRRPAEPAEPLFGRGPDRGADEAGVTSATTRAGIPVRIRRETAAPQPESDEEGARELLGESAEITIDESMAPPEVLPASLADTSGTQHPASNAAALAWAERNRPEAFASLTRHLGPYARMSDAEQTAIGRANALLGIMRTTFRSAFDTHALSGTVMGFESRMAIEPVGNLHLERIEMYPAGVERGELIHTVPLAPGETVNISHREWAVSQREFEEIVNDYFEGYSEEGVAEKTDIAMSSDSQSQHSTALNIGASLSASYASVTLSTSLGYSSTSNDSQSKKDSRNHSMAITKKASSRTKKDHKVSFKVVSIAGSEDQSVRVISNPSDTDAMRIDYFQFARKWKVDLLRYGLRMTYDIVIPNPGSAIVTLVEDVKGLDKLINEPFTFGLPLTAITYNSLAADPHDISNYDELASQWNATVTAPPEARKWVNVHYESPDLDYDKPAFASIDFEIDSHYYIHAGSFTSNFAHHVGDNRSKLHALGGTQLHQAFQNLIGMSGRLSLDLEFQYIERFAINVTFICRPKIQTLLDWRLTVWNEIRQAAEDQYAKDLQGYKDRRAQLIQEIADFDALTLRRMEQEEIMKGVLRWLLGPQFYLVPFNISSLFGQDSNDPGASDVLDPNQLSASEWLNVMEFGEFIKYLHNAIEWENVLYFTYPYFWDDNKLWEFKKFLYHPDPTHRKFLRAGAARVVLTIRPGFETSFTSLVESGSFNTLPGPHPYVTIAQEIQDFAKTNYPGFPPANPEQNARPLLYLEQQRVWREMQFIVQLLDACKAATGAYPVEAAGNTVPAAALTPYLDGAIVVNGVNFNGINDYNTQANAQKLILDPNTPQDALLPTYAAVPVNDLAWGNPYFYKCPGNTGDYDLICYGADGVEGGTDKDADISANAEASLIATWFEYTPINGLDIGVTMNAPNVVPPQPSDEIG